MAQRERLVFGQDKFRKSCRNWLLIAIAIIILSVTFNISRYVRPHFLGFIASHEYITDIPGWIDRITRSFSWSKVELLINNRTLEREKTILFGKIQVLQALARDYNDLRDLLGISSLVGYLDHNVAEIKSIVRNSSNQKMILDKGSKHHLEIDQIVVGPQGIIGQIVSTGPEHSEVLLITSNQHKIPAVSERTHIKFLARGNHSNLLASHINIKADIIEGDIILSSGDGNRFPKSYVIGQVVDIIYENDLSYKTVVIQPATDFSSIHYVVVAKKFYHEK